MTLIAASTNYQNPVLFSDILFTSHVVNQDVLLPTVPVKTKEYLDSSIKWRPVFLKQKMYIPHKDLCVLLAGDFEEMKEYLIRLKSFCFELKGQRLSQAEIRAFLEKNKPEEFLKESAVFICYVERFNDESGYCHQIKYGPWGVRRSEVLENIYACASGSEACLKLATQPTYQYSSNEKDDQIRAIQANMNFVSILLTREWTNQNSIKDGWGAGYEIAHYNGQEFQKLDNLCYVLWRGNFDRSLGDLGIPVPRIILHYKYFKNRLRITSLVLEKIGLIKQEDTLIFSVEKFSVTPYLIPEIDSTREEYIEVNDLSFRTYLISQGFAIPTLDGMIKTPGFFTYSKDVVVEYDGKRHLRLSLPKALLNDIRSVIK